MLWSSPADLAQAGFVDFHQQLFLYLWHEAIDRGSFPSWQARLCNANRLCQELSDCDSISRTFSPYQRNAGPLIDELVQCVKSDPVLNLRYPAATQLLLRLPSNKKSVHQAGDIARLGRSLMPRYTTAVADSVRDSILEVGKHPDSFVAMQDMAKCTGLLLTALLDKGYGRRYLRDLADPDVCGGDFESWLNNLLSVCGRDSSQYNVAIRIRFWKEGPRAFPWHVHDIELMSSPPAWVAAERKGAEAERPTRRVSAWAVLTVRGLDPFSAGRQALDRVNQLVSSILAVQQSRVRASRSDVWVRSEDGHVTQADSGGNLWPGLTGTGRWEMKTRAIEDLRYRLSKHEDSKQSQRLSACLEYHTVGLLAPSEESRLVNWWIAAEALVKSAEDPLDAVLSAVPKSVASQRIWSEAVGLYRYIKLACRHGPMGRNSIDAKSLDSALGGGGWMQDGAGKICEMAIGGFRDAEGGRFLAAAKTDPLVWYRLRDFAARLSSPQADVATFIRKHCSTVEWQLRRVQRCRNEIVHNGAARMDASTLALHLHNYLTMVVLGIALDMRIGRRRRLGLSEAIEIRKSAYDIWVKELDRQKIDKTTRIVRPESRYWKI